MGMYPDEQTVVIDGVPVSFPGLKAGKFTNGNPEDPDDKPSSIPAESLNLILDNLQNFLRGMGWEPNNHDAWQFTKGHVERSHYVGEIFPLMDYQPPSPWNPANPDAYFPAVCLTAPDRGTANKTVVLTADKAPLAVEKLRKKRAVYREGLDGEVGAFSVTGWNRTSNVVTLTFANTLDVVAALGNLLEENLVHGSYTDWMSISLPVAVGTVPIGDYSLTLVDPVVRQVKFPNIGADGSGTGSWTAEFHPFRVPGNPNAARFLAMQGRTLVAVNDPLGEFFAGFRRRDRFQRSIFWSGSQPTWSGFGKSNVIQDDGADGGYRRALMFKNGYLDTNVGPQDDGLNGPPRNGPTTEVRSLGVHYYYHLGPLYA